MSNNVPVSGYATLTTNLTLCLSMTTTLKVSVGEPLPGDHPALYSAWEGNQAMQKSGAPDISTLFCNDIYSESGQSAEAWSQIHTE